MKNQKGITAVVVLLAVLTVVVVGFAGYYVYNMQKDKNEPGEKAIFLSEYS